MHRGYVTVHRKILDNPVVFKDADHIAVWIYLMLNATHKNFQALFKGQSITLLPGQLITGRLSIAKKLKINDSKVKRILNLFKNEQLIDQQTTNQNSLITLVSWGKYQKSDQQSDQRVTNGWTTGDQRVTTNKNVNNVQEQKNVQELNSSSCEEKPKRKIASTYTEDFEKFWRAYPSKVGKADAAKKFQKAIKIIPFDSLISAVERYCKSKRVLDGFVCNPATWLHQERWNDMEVKTGNLFEEKDQVQLLRERYGSQ